MTDCVQSISTQVTFNYRTQKHTKQHKQEVGVLEKKSRIFVLNFT